MQGLESLPEGTNFFVLEMANKKGFLLKSHRFFLFNTGCKIRFTKGISLQYAGFRIFAGRY
jgi:hypothetical protein